MSLQHPSLDQVAYCPQGKKPNSLYLLLEPFFVLYTVTSRLRPLGKAFAKLDLLTFLFKMLFSLFLGVVMIILIVLVKRGN